MLEQGTRFVAVFIETHPYWRIGVDLMRRFIGGGAHKTVVFALAKTENTKHSELRDLRSKQRQR